MSFFFENSDIDSNLVFGRKVNADCVLEFVVPTYKRKSLLIKAVKSLIYQKKPKQIKYHITIVSNDPDLNIYELQEILREDMVTIYINRSNLGMVGNINRCSEISSAQYVAYLQDDDVLLDNYVIEFEELYLSGKLEKIDCLIPNRYTYIELNQSNEAGAKIYNSISRKQILGKILALGKKVNKFQRITWRDCADTWNNAFMGGPTCGIVFNREALLASGGFNYEYPFGFDYVFFIDFSEKYNVCLYNKYLSVYRMTQSASNRSEVQYDFFRASKYLLNKSYGKVTFVNKYYNEMLLFILYSRPVSIQKFIMEREEHVPEKNKLKYGCFKIIRFIKLLRSGQYRLKKIPKKVLISLDI